ncbi:MAG TPA: NAD(P)H-dependent oxidoreductase, partial [Solirubrobacterales bacterium]|nr:NAD(P)H-dependent oxidoreductase [Solirubrobacterales bacterium]
MRILTISGSLRRGSHNSRLLRAASDLVPAGVELELYEGLGEIPAYDDDRLAEPPAPVRRLRSAVERADAVLIA